MADVVTVDDIQGSTRRSWLKYLAIAAGAGGGGWFLFGSTSLRPLWLTVTIDPNIDGVRIDDDAVVVEFAADVSGDEWVIAHEYQDVPDDALASGSVPEFGGEITIPRSHVDSDRFPTRRFQIVLFSIEETSQGGVGSLETRRETGIHIEIPKREAA